MMLKLLLGKELENSDKRSQGNKFDAAKPEHLRKTLVHLLKTLIHISYKNIEFFILVPLGLDYPSASSMKITPLGLEKENH